MKMIKAVKEMKTNLVNEHTFRNRFNKGPSCCEEACSLALARVILGGSTVEIDSAMVIPQVAAGLGSDGAQ